MQERGLGVFELLRDVARETEVWVLVDGAGNEAGDVVGFAEDLRERVGKGGCGLDRCKVYLANIVAVVGFGFVYFCQ